MTCISILSVFFFLTTLSGVNLLKQAYNFLNLQHGSKTHIYNNNKLSEYSNVLPNHYGNGVLPFPQTYDFNPILLNGIRGYPGIKARINLRAFQYFSLILNPILSQQIKRARIPNINQCIPQVSGCIQVYNIYVSRFRCPQRVILYPEIPNLISIAIENFDIGVTGNLGGQINILLPIALFGIVQMNAHQVSVQVSLAVNRNPSGGVSIYVHRCYTTVGYVDAYVENGGLVGDIANSQFRGKISEMVRSSLPTKICQQLPSLINEQLNAKTNNIPQSIPLSQLLQSAMNAFNLNSLLNKAPECSVTCEKKKVVAASALKSPQNIILKLPKNLNQSNSLLKNSYYKIVNSQHSKPNHRLAIKINKQRIIREVYANNQHYVRNNNANTATASNILLNRKSVNYQIPVPNSYIPVIDKSKPTSLENKSNQLTLVKPSTNLCNICENNSKSDSTLSILSFILQSLDFNKLSNIYLNVQLLQSLATKNDFTIDLNGEFSLYGGSGTPFGAFPINFPNLFGYKMAEILISDWTANSLFYQLHKVGFLTIKITPETPKIGDLLKTTCSSDDDDDDDEDFEDHDIEDENSENNITVVKPKQRNVKTHLTSLPINLKRVRRQDDNSLASLGICFGDILPKVREKYPNQKIIIIIQSSRAPFILLSAKNGGIATVDFVLNANIHIQSTNERVGIIEISSTIEFLVQTTNDRISGHANITQLRLRDITNSFGLSQDALDNLGNIGKELLLKAANDALEKGVPLKIPPNFGGFPLTFINPEIKLIEHGVYLSSDFTIDSSTIAQLFSSKSGY